MQESEICKRHISAQLRLSLGYKKRKQHSRAVTPQDLTSLRAGGWVRALMGQLQTEAGMKVKVVLRAKGHLRGRRREAAHARGADPVGGSQSGSKTTRGPRALNATLRSLEPKAFWQNCHLCLLSLPRNGLQATHYIQYQ